jgi:hypothetical protein
MILGPWERTHSAEVVAECQVTAIFHYVIALQEGKGRTALFKFSFDFTILSAARPNGICRGMKDEPEMM